MAEETKKMTEEPVAEPAPAEEKPAAEERLNYVSGNTWKCQGCGLSNHISTWNCIACYSSMKNSMQKDKSLRQREARAQDERRRKRQAKRDKLYAKKMAASSPSPMANGDKLYAKKTTTAEVKSEEPAEVKVDPLKFKLSENIPKTMRALIKESATKGFVLKNDLEVPTPKEDELLIRSFAVAICGSDRMLYEWTKAAQSVAKVPFIPGHEACGLVVGVGRNCRFRIGERVAIENHFFCGECYQCTTNRKDICSKMGQFGHGKGTMFGGCCDYYTVKERYCYRLKADITWTEAALLEPLGVAHNACEQADLAVAPERGHPKEVVLVVGCGPIGCLAVGVAKTMAATGKVLACDVVDAKLEVARKMGADVTFNAKTLRSSLREHVLALTDGVGVGRIIECSGAAKTISQLFGCLRKGGAITLVGLPKEALVVEHPMADLVFKSIQIRSVHGRRIFRTWKKTERLVAEKRINLKPLVSHHLALADFERGYEALEAGKAMKVVFDLTK